MTDPRDRSADDLATVIALALLAYTTAIVLHEHVGHALACVALGGPLTELGAFYVDFDGDRMTDVGRRLVAVAGPVVSLFGGLLGFLLLDRLRRASPHAGYVAWLLGTINLMIAAGYLLFSGVSGLGDLGTTRDGVLFGATPEWLWRAVLTVLGLASYAAVVAISLRKADSLLGGEGPGRVRRAQRLALTSYLTGAAMSVLVGLLNPHGIVLVLMSAAASSLGGTSALSWMMQLLDRKKAGGPALLALARSPAWILAGLAVTLVYAAVFGPTIRFPRP